jgi:hypothetical protein
MKMWQAYNDGKKHLSALTLVLEGVRRWSALTVVLEGVRSWRLNV